MKFQSELRTKVMTIFPRLPVWNVIWESAKTLTSSDHISENIARQTLKFRPKFQNNFSLNGIFFLASETPQKKSYSENSIMTCLE